MGIKKEQLMPVLLQALRASSSEYHIYMNSNSSIVFIIYNGYLHESAVYCFVSSGIGFVPYRDRVHAFHVNTDVQFYQVCLSSVPQFQTFTLELMYKITLQF